MSDSKPSIDPKFSFAAGWLLGRRGRNNNGVGCLFLIFGALGILMALGSLISAPLSWLDAREAKQLVQPSAAEFVTLAPGTKVLTIGQLSPDAATGDHGLALFYTEVMQESSATDDPEIEGDGSDAASSGWQREPEVGWHAELRAADGTLLTVQLPADASLGNSSTVVDAEDSNRRYVGYLPGQAIALRASWEGANLLTAEELYAGSIDDYTRHLSRRPGFMLFGGMLCGGIALLFLMMGGVLRFLGN